MVSLTLERSLADVFRESNTYTHTHKLQEEWQASTIVEEHLDSFMSVCTAEIKNALPERFVSCAE